MTDPVDIWNLIYFAFGFAAAWALARGRLA